jgi:hypothetical protein
MGNLFDPNNPNTWPENYKAPTTAAYTNKGVPARDLAESKVKNRFKGLTPETNDPYYESGKALFDMGVMQPIKSMGRSVTGKNAAVYANPFNGAGWKERGMALGEDVLNVAALYPGAKAATAAGRAALADSYFMGETFLHGSPTRGLTEIKPFSNSVRFPDHTLSYGMNPNPSNIVPMSEILDRVSNYAQGGMGSNAGGSVFGREGGSIYVAKTRQGDIIRGIPSVPGTPSNYGTGSMVPGHIHGGEVTLSGAPSKVISEIPYSNKEFLAGKKAGWDLGRTNPYQEDINRQVLEALGRKSRAEELARKLATKFVGDYKVPTRPHKYIPPRPTYEFAPGELQP